VDFIYNHFFKFNPRKLDNQVSGFCGRSNKYLILLWIELHNNNNNIISEMKIIENSCLKSVHQFCMSVSRQVFQNNKARITILNRVIQKNLVNVFFSFYISVIFDILMGI